MKKILGIFIICLPFIGLFIWWSTIDGFLETLKVLLLSLGLTLVVIVCVAAGTYLIKGKLE